MASCFGFQLRSQVPNVKVQICPMQRLLQAIQRWCDESNSIYYPYSWVDEQLETFGRYVSHVDVDPLFSSQIYEELHQEKAWKDGHFRSIKYTRDAQLVTRIVGELGDLFKVPKLKQLSHSHSEMDSTTLRKDQLVAGFLNFLLHLLHSHQHFTAAITFQDVVHHIVKELRILLTIIGDRPFRATENEEVQSILEELELVVNEVGAFVHSLVFIPHITVEEMKESFEALLKQIQLFKTNITKFLQQLPNIVLIPRSNSSMNSPLILVCLMHDIEDLIDLDDNTLVEVKKQSKRLHQLLFLCQSILSGKDIDELRNELVAVQIISIAYDAKYIVSAFLDGEIPPCYLTVRLTHLIDHIALDATRLQDMKQDCTLMSSKLTKDFRAQLSLQTKKDSLADDIIVGFEQHEGHIFDLLLQGTEELQEIFIYGMPGIGKTTLARRMYHHPMVSRHFDRRSWCVVSQTYNRKNLLIDILISITSDRKEDRIREMEEGSLELKIYQILKDRRYLMVMDDLWDSEVWDNLHFLPNDQNGSRILFTSRSKDVAPCGGNSITHELPVLSNDQCWELLEKKAFHNNPCPPQLLEVGKRIAAKCYGLPLVVVVIAGILSTTDMEERNWENMVRSLNSYMVSDKSNSIMQILEVSYKHLPLHLQICFLYFRVFKEDQRIHVTELLRLWIAEGFICKRGENKRAECVAKEYLAELIDKNLVIVVKRGSDGGAKICVIHDLFHELCLKIASKDKFLKLTDCGVWSDYKAHIHGTAVFGKPLYRASPNHLESSSSVRNRWISSFSFNHIEVRTRVLGCKAYFYYVKPGNEVLYPSRYLSLREMPTSLHNFVNLEFLIVSSAVRISSRILEMAKLKCICAEYVYFGSDCNTWSRTSRIEYLSEFVIRRPKHVKMLACLPLLHKLKCSYQKNGSLECLDLEFLTQIECLKVACFGFGGLDRIFDIKFPSNVGKLTLSFLKLSPRMMSTIGALPYLHVLKLQGSFPFDQITDERWDTSDGEFKQLRILKLRRLNLTQWNVPSSEHFPKLKQLYLESCRWLIEIPREIGEIETLQFIDVSGECKKSLVDSALRIEEEQKDMGNEEFRVAMQNLREVNSVRLEEL